MQGELGNVVGQLLEIFRTILLVREKPLDNGLGVTVMQALADDAQPAEADLLRQWPRDREIPGQWPSTAAPGGG